MKTLKTILQEVISGIKAWASSTFAQDNNTVHKTGDETIGGAKVLTYPLAIVKNPGAIFMTNPDITLGTPPTDTNRYYGDYYLDINEEQVGYSLFQCNKNGNNCILWGVVNTDGTNTYQSQIKFTVFPSGGNALFPSWSGCDLGLATNKWESFNGVNPGILSFPNINYTPNNPDSCDVSTAIYNGLTASSYTPPRWSWTAPLSGWLTIVWYTKGLSSTAPHRVTITAGGEATSTKFGQTFSSPDAWYYPTTIPVVSGVTYYFDISFKRTDSAGEIFSAYIVPCQGNV